MFYGFEGISQSFEINFILEINENLDCPPNKDLNFDVRFEDMPLKFIKKEYPFYSVAVNEKFFIKELSLNLFYNGKQLEMPPQSFNTFDNGHFKIQIDTCKIKNCLQIISYGVAQYQSIDCTLGDFPGLTIEIFNPSIVSGDYISKLSDMAKNESIPFSERLKLRKILRTTFSSLESYYSSLTKRQ